MDYLNLIIKHLQDTVEDNFEIAVMVAHCRVESETGVFLNLSDGDIQYIKESVLH